MHEERSERLMNYLNRPLDDVAELERQKDRWNNDLQTTVSQKSDPKMPHENRSNGIKRVVLRTEHANKNYYRGGYRPGPSYMYKGYVPFSYGSINRNMWASRYNTASGGGYYRGRSYDRRDFERRVEHDRGGGVSRGGKIGRPYSSAVYRGARNYYRGGRDYYYYYRGRKYMFGNYYYRKNFPRRFNDAIIGAPKKPMINGIGGGKVGDIYRRPLIKDSARRIIKEVGVGKNPRNTVVATGINRYNIIPPVGMSRFNNLNISLYRNRMPVFPVTGRGRISANPVALSRRNINSKSRLRGVGLKKTPRRINDKLKGENKIDTYLMSKIKIYTSPENVPPPLTQQLDADVNLPRSLQRRSAHKKED